MNYTLYNYFDVYAEETDDGRAWIVNNQCIECSDIVITDDASASDIAAYLKAAGYLTTDDLSRVEIVGDGDYIEINDAADGMPLYGLMLNY